MCSSPAPQTMVDGPHGPHLPYETCSFENTAPLSRFSLVVAHTRAGVIGDRATNGLPWATLSADLARFKAVTTTTHRPSMRNAVIMGRNTWESLPRRLKGRVNIIVTSRRVVDGADGVDVLKSSSLLDALRTCEALSFVDRVFVIGGGQLFAEALSPACRDGIDYIFSTVVDDALVVSSPRTDHGICVDTTMWTDNADEFELLWRADGEGGPHPLTFCTYGSRGRHAGAACTTPDPCINYPHPHEECQYLCLIDSILRSGACAADRTGTGTLSQFGVHVRFSLQGGAMPLLTTKKTFFRGVKEELMTLFIPGCTDVKVLQDKGVRIWDGNVAAKASTDASGLSPTDMGPMYGFQWRHFGAPHLLNEGDVGGGVGVGVDQLAWVLNEIKTNPSSRRLVVSAWNPVDLPRMALPPCHVMFQFFVREGRLSCMMTQRSADVGLGLPFNIASYALLTHLVAHATELEPEELVVSIGDAHIYKNHEGALLEQYFRQPLPFCRLVIAPGTTRDLFDIRPEAVTVEDYKHQSAIPMPLSV